MREQATRSRGLPCTLGTARDASRWQAAQQLLVADKLRVSKGAEAADSHRVQPLQVGTSQRVTVRAYDGEPGDEMGERLISQLDSCKIMLVRPMPVSQVVLEL